MTNTEAIETLRANYPDACFEQLREAVDAAIVALKAQNASGDTISRQAAIREYQKVCNEIKCGECPFLIKVNTEKGSHLITDCKLEVFLHSLPSAERRGRWIDITKCGGCSVFKCSECGDLQLEESYYCPNCGARMDGEEE